MIHNLVRFLCDSLGSYVDMFTRGGMTWKRTLYSSGV